MLDCPKCGAAVDGLHCVRCGYAEPGTALAAKPPLDPNRHLCMHVWEGQRCAKAGSLSEGTKGDGPWYCAQHFPPFAGRRYGLKPTAPPSGFRSIKELAAGIKPKEAA